MPEPSIAPALLMKRSTGSENTPFEARNPANGNTSSEGMGTSVLSSVTRMNTPGYPSRATMSWRNAANSCMTPAWG